MAKRRAHACFPQLVVDSEFQWIADLLVGLKIPVSALRFRPCAQPSAENLALPSHQPLIDPS